MTIIRGLLDRIVLLVGVVAAGCVPSFIAQYQQRLGGRLEQVLADIAPFQAIADRFHGGSLDALISYHLQSPDATFHQEGEALQAMVSAASSLRAALQALHTDLPHQCIYLLMHHDPALARSTWEAFVPGFTLTPSSIGLALVGGVTLWLVFMGLLFGADWLGSTLVQALMRRSRPAPAPMRIPPRMK